MKRISTLVICAAMVLCLCSCSGRAAESETVTLPVPTETVAPQPEATAVPEATQQPEPAVDVAAETEALKAVLQQIDEEARPGSAGSSLTAARIAADMLNWAVTTKLDGGQISEICLQWLTDMGYGQQSEFNRKLDDVYYAYQSLIAENSADLMSSAGLDYPEGNWGYEPVPAVEAIESAVGPSDMVY